MFHILDVFRAHPDEKKIVSPDTESTGLLFSKCTTIIFPVTVYKPSIKFIHIMEVKVRKKGKEKERGLKRPSFSIYSAKLIFGERG